MLFFHCLIILVLQLRKVRQNRDIEIFLLRVILQRRSLFFKSISFCLVTIPCSSKRWMKSNLFEKHCFAHKHNSENILYEMIVFPHTCTGRSNFYGHLNCLNYNCLSSDKVFFIVIAQSEYRFLSVHDSVWICQMYVKFGLSFGYEKINSMIYKILQS